MRVAPTHPGEMFIEDFLPYTDDNLSSAAAEMGMSLNRLSEIVLGKRSVTPETAVLFEKFSGIPAELWLQLQLNHDLWHALRDTDVAKVKAAKKYSATKAERAAAAKAS